MIQYQIVHQIPGRLRIKIDSLPGNKRLVEEKIRNIAHVTRVQLNESAKSFIISYNAKKETLENFQQALAFSLCGVTTEKSTPPLPPEVTEETGTLDLTEDKAPEVIEEMGTLDLTEETKKVSPPKRPRKPRNSSPKRKRPNSNS